MASTEISQGARHIVSLNAEELSQMGVHLNQVAGIIRDGCHLYPKKGARFGSVRLSEKLELYKEYQEEIAEKRAKLEKQLQDEMEALKAWRKDAGTEGASLLEELEMYMDKARELEKLLAAEKIKLACEKSKTRELVSMGEMKDKKWESLSDAYCKLWDAKRRGVKMASAQSSWIQCSFDEIRFKFKKNVEAEKLMVEHHRQMRKNRAKARLDVIRRERTKRLLQACVMAFQEELVDGRWTRYHNELIKRHNDEMLVLQAQVAQALGDEERAKALFEEQTRRMKAAREAQAEAERQRDVALREAREARAAEKEAREAEARALAAQAKAEKERDDALAEAEQCRQDAAKARDERDEAISEMKREIAKRERAEKDLKTKLKKIDQLQRMLAELGAESDDDGPYDERPPPFFVNEDGSKIPRPRARKERMAMAYREAESARFELRLAIAAIIDKELNHEQIMKRLKSELRMTESELDQIRWANKVLIADVNENAAELEAARAENSGGFTAYDLMRIKTPGIGQNEVPSSPVAEPPAIDAGVNGTLEVHSRLMKTPLAPSSAAVPWYSPSQPNLAASVCQPMGVNDKSPRFLTQSPSAPILMPATNTEAGIAKGLGGEKITLAPLRKKKRSPPNDWRVGWH